LRPGIPQTNSHWKHPSSSLSSRPERGDLRFRRPLVEMFFDKAYPDFRPRSTRQGRVCAFLSGKAHDVCQRHQLLQEIRGSVVERSAVSFRLSRRLFSPRGTFLAAYERAKSSLFCCLEAPAIFHYWRCHQFPPRLAQLCRRRGVLHRYKSASAPGIGNYPF